MALAIVVAWVARPSIALSKPATIALSVVPRHVYKVADALDTKEKSEVWYFQLVVDDAAKPSRPASETIELFSGTRMVSSTRLTGDALEAIRGRNLSTRSGLNESFDLRHHFREPAALAIDRIHYQLEVADSLDGNTSTQSIDIPVRTYAQKTKLIFPIRGNFIVTNGNVTEGGHHEWSQFFAYDIIGLGPHYEWIVSGDGTKNEDFAGWGREVIVPGDGVVSYARNDVPSNPAPGQIDMKMLESMPEPNWSVAGNVVVIDHGNGEFSCFGHMQPGSVRVKRGQRVKQGQVIGLLGNSGHSQGPHVHYHLMNGPLLFKSDGLPSRFENVEGGTPVQGNPSEAK